MQKLKTEKWYCLQEKLQKMLKNAEKAMHGIFCGASIELHDGTIITGKNSPLMHASSSLILNATKHLAGIPDKMYLLPENIIDSVTYLKKEYIEWQNGQSGCG